MKAKHKLKTLYAIATMAVEHGLDIVVDLTDRQTGSKVLNGFVTDTSSQDGGVILRAYHPDPVPASSEEPEEDEPEPTEEDAGFDMVGF